MSIPSRIFCTEAERQELREALAERGAIPDVSARDVVVLPPAAADASWEGGLRYALGRLWQDKPALVVFGGLALLLSFVLE